MEGTSRQRTPALLELIRPAVAQNKTNLRGARGVATLTLMVGHTFYNTTLPIAISNGMLVHTCIYLWVF